MNDITIARITIAFGSACIVLTFFFLGGTS